jgi:hypothetical protein
MLSGTPFIGGVDTRGACNSGIYVRGFGRSEADAAFEYGCSQFPTVIKRQKFPLVLQNRMIHRE